MTQAQVEPRKGREGSRWFNERPDSAAVAEWFKEVPLHDGMNHDRYIGGIVLIEQKVKLDEVTGFGQDGRPIIAARRGKDSDNRVEHLTYTPYPKVETRVQYFWDLMAAHSEWVGIIEPVGGDPAIGPGFSKRVFVGSKNGKALNFAFVVSQMRVVVYERDTYAERIMQKGHRGEVEVVRTGKTVIAGAPATKMVAVNNSWGDVDQFAMMKAETGAVGRALGMAGMLVVPGAGVATAEDMNEAAALEARPSAPAPTAAELPTEAAAEPDAESEEGLRARATDLINELRADHPKAYEAFQEWAKGRKVESLASADKLALKGIVKKAEKDLEAARNAAAEEATAEATG